MTGIKTCPICNKTFDGTKFRANKIYCSPDCLAESQRRSKMQSPPDTKDFEKVCEWCGKKFIITNSYQYGKRYCSNDCKKESAATQRHEKDKRVKATPGRLIEKRSKKNMYIDPETGTVYLKKDPNIKLIQIANEAYKLGLSYGQYTSREYAPKIREGHIIELSWPKEKRYQNPKFIWKEN